MDDFDRLAQDIAQASSPFDLGNDWSDIQAGFAALAKWKADVSDRLDALEGKTPAAGG